MLFQQSDGLLQTLSNHQFTRVGWCRTCHQQVEVVVHARCYDLSLYFLPVAFLIGKDVGDAVLAVADAEELSHSRLSDIESNHDGLLLQQSEAHGKVRSDEGLTFSGCGRGHDEYLFLVVTCQLQVGTQSSEDFRHQVALVFLYHDAALASVGAGCWDVSDYRELCQFLYIVVTQNLAAQQFAQVDDTGRDGCTQDECDEQCDDSLRTYLINEGCRLDDLCLVGG